MNQNQAAVKNWMDRLGLGFFGTGKTPFRPSDGKKPDPKFGKHQGSKKGFTHRVNPVFVPGFSGITPAEYRRKHMGMTSIAKRQAKLVAQHRKGRKIVKTHPKA